jgi:hypothetical protein
MPCRSIRVALLIATLALSGCETVTEAPSVPGTPDALLPDELRAQYHTDGLRLAARHLETTGAYERNDVELPAALVTTLFNALSRVYAVEHPARDSVVELHRIHTFPDFPLHEVLVGVDPAQSWVQEWQSGNRLTGEPTVDAPMQADGLELVRYYGWISGNAVLLRSNQPLNTAALSRRFTGIAGVRYVEPNRYAGDGNDIRARIQGGAWRLDYSFGTGDCPAGCTYRRTWSFLVESSGAVRFLGVTTNGG